MQMSEACGEQTRPLNPSVVILTDLVIFIIFNIDDSNDGRRIQKTTTALTVAVDIMENYLCDSSLNLFEPRELAREPSHVPSDLGLWLAKYRDGERLDSESRGTE